MSFTPIEATLTVINSTKPDEYIVFSSPMSTAALKGCHDVQNLGAVQTYMRRYLYFLALEIVEHDELDAVTGKEQPQSKKPTVTPPQAKAAPPQPEYEVPPEQEGVRLITEKQRSRLFTILKGSGKSEADLKAYLLNTLALDSTKKIPAFLYEQVCDWIEGKE